MPSQHSTFTMNFFFFCFSYVLEWENGREKQQQPQQHQQNFVIVQGAV